MEIERNGKLTACGGTAADFSLVAPVYRWLEFLAFGRALERRRLAFLEHVLNAKKVLILGDGDGRFTEKLLEAHKIRSSGALKLEIVESSRRMMSLTQRRTNQLSREFEVKFQLTDVQCAVFSGPYDLIISHFFLDCFSTAVLQQWITRLMNHTTADAQWLISEFAVPEQRPWRMLGRLLILLMYFFFRLTAGLRTTKLPDYKPLLTDQGFRAVKSERAMRGLLKSELWTRLPLEQTQPGCHPPGSEQPGLSLNGKGFPPRL